MVWSIYPHESSLVETVAILGTSMGAVTAGGVFAKHKTLKCLVGLIGTFAWEDAARRGLLPKADGYEAQIQAYDPLSKASQIAERPILMCNGKADPIMPYEHQAFFYEQLKPYYVKQPERLQLLGWDGMPHAVATTMHQQAVMWLKTYL